MATLSSRLCVGVDVLVGMATLGVGVALGEGVPLGRILAVMQSFCCWVLWCVCDPHSGQNVKMHFSDCLTCADSKSQTWHLMRPMIGEAMVKPLLVNWHAPTLCAWCRFALAALRWFQRPNLRMT